MAAGIFFHFNIEMKMANRELVPKTRWLLFTLIKYEDEIYEELRRRGIGVTQLYILDLFAFIN